MKRINSFMLAAVAIFAAASCQKEMANEPLQNEGGDFTVTATTVADTKTVLDDVNNIIYWAPGDQISLFNTSGAEVVFSTDITTNQTKANFTNDTEFDAPSSLLAVYPTRTDKTTTYDAANNTIRTLHIGGVQNALAGGFDSRYAVAVGTPKTAGSTELEFNNIHTLIKFTVGGETAPNTVTLKNNGVRPIAGNFDYDLSTNTTTMTAGEPKITLNGPFEVGETYYIAMTPGICGGGISLEFDGIVVKNTGEDKTLMPNKIYNLGTLEAPEQTEPEKTPSVSMQASEVLSKKSEGDASWLTSLVNGTANMDRNAAFDGTNVYIANVNTTTPAIYAIPLATPENVAMVDMTEVSGGHFPISCVRTIPNGNEQILIASNMAMATGDIVKIYAWEDGIDQQPTIMCNNWAIPGWAPRRFGDQFTVCGDWTKGELWFRSQSSATTAKYNIVNGVLQNPGSPDGWGNIAQDHVYLGSVYRYNMSATELLVVPGGNVNAAMYDFDGNKTALSKSYNNIGGLTPFTYNEKNFIAYVSINEVGGKIAKLVVIEDAENDLQTALNDNLVVFEANINSDGNNCGAGNTGMSCNVVTTGGKTYLFGHAQNIGFVVYEITGLTTL